MHTKTLSAPWALGLAWDELLTLMVCIGLDFVEYIFPVLMAPLVGDLLDLAGLIFGIVFFGWLGLIALLEIVPGLDVLPIYTAMWLIWYIFNRRYKRAHQESQLEKWK